jgi:hypothetical protein
MGSSDDFLGQVDWTLFCPLCDQEAIGCLQANKKAPAGAFSGFR